MFLVFAAVTPYKEFFQTARMMIVGNFGAGLYLAGVIPAVLEVKKRTRFMLTILIGVILIAGLLKFANHGAVKSIVAFKKMAEVMKSCDAYINVNAGHFKMEERKEVKLYNPDKLVKSTAQEEKLKQINEAHDFLTGVRAQVSCTARPSQPSSPAKQPRPKDKYWMMPLVSFLVLLIAIGVISMVFFIYGKEYDPVQTQKSSQELA